MGHVCKVEPSGKAVRIQSHDGTTQIVIWIISPTIMTHEPQITSSASIVRGNADDWCGVKVQSNFYDSYLS